MLVIFHRLRHNCIAMCTNIAHVTHLRACQLTAARAVTFPNVCIAEILEDMDLSFLLQAYGRVYLYSRLYGRFPKTRYSVRLTLL